MIEQGKGQGGFASSLFVRCVFPYPQKRPERVPNSKILFSYAHECSDNDERESAVVRYLFLGGEDESEVDSG